MVLSYMSLPWFYGINVLLELSFSIICLVVAIFAFKIYKDTGQRLVKYFGLSFFLISISYLIESVLNFLIASNLNKNICIMIKARSVAGFNAFGMFVHMLFMTLGLSILLYTTLKDKRIKTMWLIIAVALSSVFLSENSLYMFYVISTVFTAFIAWHYLQNYLKFKDTKTVLVALAFLFLLFGSFHFLISVNHQIFYVIGRILEFFAYFFILVNLYLVRKR